MIPDTAFDASTITRYEGIPAIGLVHSYNPVRTDASGKPIDFSAISATLGSKEGYRANPSASTLYNDVARWYAAETGKEMDTLALGDAIEEVRERFWGDPRFAEAFGKLELDYDDRTKALIPWWNEVAAGELSHETLGDKAVHVALSPRHSLETQLMRKGVDRPVKNVSVGGLLLTESERGAEDGYLVIGLRGGASFSNTYHINAGALRVNDSLKKGTSTIYDQFRNEELEKEFGIGQDDVASAQLFARLNDLLIDQGPTYLFAVQTNLSRSQLHDRWEKNLDDDKKEHDAPVFIPANPGAVNDFIAQHYRGAVENRKRGDDERFLLHPGALALASYSGLAPSDLKMLVRPGVW